MRSGSKGVAWYDVRGQGWLRDIFVLLHPPYTAWHLSYAVIGAALAPRLNWAVLGWTVLAFFLAMGIAGHFLDELNGRPLKTTLPGWILLTIAVLGIAGAGAIGGIIGLSYTLWVLPCILFGIWIVVAYNLEWPPASWKDVFIANLFPTGFFHRDIWFGIAWGAFPLVTAYIAQTHTLSIDAVLLAAFALLYSMAQRKLSMQSRFWRRKVSSVTGLYTIQGVDLPILEHSISKETLTGPYDLALKLLNGAIVSIAVGLLIMHLLKGGV